jgi:hypothetical protein
VTANPTSDVTLLDLIILDELIGCTSCGAEVTSRDSKCIEGHRACGKCFGPDPFPLSELEPPF